jgi:hypothetical protein
MSLEPRGSGRRLIGMGHPRLLLAPILGLLITVLTACGHSSSRVEPACCPPENDSRVSGVLVGIGGPSATAVQHWPGTIRVRGTVFSRFGTDAHGHFSQALPAGTYRFTATSPSYESGHATCQASRAVRLRKHHTTHVRVVCQLR